MTNEQKLIPRPAVRRRYGISETTMWRWENEPKVGFPQADLIVGKRKFYREETLTDWELSQVRKAGRI